ncbi:MAG: FHA domain-containing protein [Phycisphaerales bacterium]|nr:FHA domain-containing protein [Phycisphaerales bacterium]
MKVKLHVFKENGDRKEVPVKPGKHVIGRGEDASIRVPLASVSRRHCEIEVTEDAVLVRDLGSSNGTKRNYQPIDEAELRAGDVLSVGDVLFTVQINGQPAKIQRPEPALDSDASADSSMMETPPIAKPGLLSGTDASDAFDFDFDLDDLD